MKSSLSPSYKYDQKEVLRTTVLAFIKEWKITSLLDIGAGLPDTALWYRKAVNTYHAVEHHKKRAECLREAGLTVFPVSFPCKVPDSYQLVLSSHSVPEDIRSYEDFIKGAWELVSPKGYLMIITFKGVVDSFIEIYSELRGVPLQPFDSEKFDSMMKVLSMLGKPRMTTVISTESSNNVNDIARSICFSLGGQRDESMQRVVDILEERFKIGSQYKFPHEHKVILICKGRFREA